MFNKDKDRGLVFEGLAPDIDKIIQDHNIPATTADVVYNNIKSLDEIGCRINDQFDGLKLFRAINALGKGNVAQPTGSSQGVAPTASTSE